jgi:hypothetical protein
MTNLLKALKRSVLQSLARRDERRILGGKDTVELDDFGASLVHPDAYYAAAHRFFHGQFHPELRTHRDFFRQERRGFGEDAFHVMWWLLLSKSRPASFLEIGVYRGQILSLAALAARLEGYPCEVHGISPLSRAGDSVSTYLDLDDYETDIRSHFQHFALPEPRLIKALSNEPAAVRHIQGRLWDVIYIDGCHDEEVCRADWELCSGAVAPGGLIVLDDSGLGTDYHPPRFASGGHPGPSAVAAQIDHTMFTEILQVGHNRVLRRIR